VGLDVERILASNNDRGAVMIEVMMMMIKLKVSDTPATANIIWQKG
jgi:hypothetical protein